MSHALILPVLRLDAERIPFHADPILAAIERHSEAWSVFQVAPEGEASDAADDETHDSLNALLATPCATRAGMLCLIRHLRWWLSEEAPNAAAHCCQGAADSWAIAEVREAELSRCLGVEPIQRLPLALPSGRLIGPTINLRPVPAPARLGRALAAAGELMAAVALIGGGCVLTGLASLL
ncbi:hypothetical protein FV226_22600 [Methylobacterium sp. WL12]|uniref:hypothetical protein n=1 Tax=Methylobacterium sp. WL12 TaxID=2603890 RepID=UPI0011CAA2E2|nr:hypothetical protein [Methylobacterium sp. WL12]TXM66964.1 hypothetical protein FV226_22600 [Methylobacterium sp. WL12]